MKSGFAFAVLAAAAVLCAGVPAAAAPIELTYSATVLEVFDDSSITDGSITPGAVLTGSLVFDLDAAASSVDPPNFAYYDFPSPPWSMTAQVGNYAFTAAGDVIHVTIGDDTPGTPVTDSFNAIAVSPIPGPIEGTFIQAGFGVVLVDLTATTLASTSLAAVPLDLGSWNEPRFNLTFLSDAGEFDTIIRIDSLSVAAPEPAELGLVALLVAAVAARVRRGLRAG